MDTVIAGWPCQGHSCTEASQGLQDPMSSQFWGLICLMQWWFSHQPSPLGYMFENVPFLGDSRNKVLEGDHNIRQHLGPPIFVDAVSIGSYAHRPK